MGIRAYQLLKPSIPFKMLLLFLRLFWIALPADEAGPVLVGRLWRCALAELRCELLIDFALIPTVACVWVCETGRAALEVLLTLVELLAALTGPVARCGFCPFEIGGLGRELGGGGATGRTRTGGIDRV